MAQQESTLNTVNIENYRGFNIYFDTCSEFFFISSDIYTERESKSLSQIRKRIDAIIKGAVSIEGKTAHLMGYLYCGQEPIKIIGINKDGGFWYSNENGYEIENLPILDSKYYGIELDEDAENNKKIRENINNLMTEIEIKQKEINSIKLQLKYTPLTEYYKREIEINK